MNIHLITLIISIYLSTIVMADNINIKEIENPNKKGPWPEFEVTTTINATPLESVAIYYALDYQKNYVPNVLKSEVIDQPTPDQAITSYEFDTPWPLPNSTYTNGSKIKKNPDGSYLVNWWFIKNSAADDVSGSATFIPYLGKTKLIYRSYIAPKNFLASFFKSTAKNDLAATLGEIKNHIEMLKKNDSEIMKKYKKIIIDALNNKFTYKKN